MMIYKSGSAVLSSNPSNTTPANKKPTLSLNHKANVNSFHTSNSNGDYPIYIGEHLNSSQESYEVENFLGKGTFGQVVKCRARNCGISVAVKVLKNHPSYLRQGTVEVQILQKLNLESDTEKCHIVQAIECFHHNGHMCLVFELLEQNLYEYLKMNKFRPMALKDIRSISFQVLLALSKLKSLGLIHADLKPENIMLVEPPDVNGSRRDDYMSEIKVKVIDFGSSCLSSKAVQNTYLQSRYYRAPEIILGLPFNEAIDMWSLGCVIAELYLGWPLFPGSSEYDQIRYILQTNGLPPREMIENGSKAKRYFVQTAGNEHHSLGPAGWRLKTAEEQFQSTGQQSKEARKYILNSLDQLATLHIDSCLGDANNNYSKTSPHSTPPSPSLLEERLELTNFLNSMLRLNPRERIDPTDALIHNFLVGHLTGRRNSIINQIRAKDGVLSNSHESLAYITDLLELRNGRINELMNNQVMMNDQLCNGMPNTPITAQYQQQELWKSFQQQEIDLKQQNLQQMYATGSQTRGQIMQTDFPPFFANNLAPFQQAPAVSPGSTMKQLLQPLDNATPAYPHQQGFLPPNVLAHSLLMSASEGVPLPPADPWMDASLDGQNDLNSGITQLNSTRQFLPQSVTNGGFNPPLPLMSHNQDLLIGQNIALNMNHPRVNTFNPPPPGGLLKDTMMNRGEFPTDIWSFAIQAAAANRNASLLNVGRNPGAFVNNGGCAEFSAREHSTMLDSRCQPLAVSLTDLSNISLHKAPTAPPPIQQGTPGFLSLSGPNTGSGFVNSATPLVGMFGPSLGPPSHYHQTASRHATPHMMPPQSMPPGGNLTLQQMQIYQQFANLVGSTPNGMGPPVATNQFHPPPAPLQPPPLHHFPMSHASSGPLPLFTDSISTGQVSHRGVNSFPAQHLVSSASSMSSPVDANYGTLTNGLRNMSEQTHFDFKDKKIPIGRVQPILKQTNQCGQYFNQSAKPTISGPALGQFQVLPSPHHAVQQSPSVSAIYQQQVNFLKSMTDQAPAPHSIYQGSHEFMPNHNLAAATNAYIQHSGLVLGCSQW